jgi:hypothetical protein
MASGSEKYSGPGGGRSELSAAAEYALDLGWDEEPAAASLLLFPLRHVTLPAPV